jgi:hypothetical protein
MEPEAYIGLHIEGRAQAQTQTKRKKIIDTLTYPGLAVKGIAAVGPTLDVYGQVRYVPLRLDNEDQSLTFNLDPWKSHTVWLT